MRRRHSQRLAERVRANAALLKLTLAAYRALPRAERKSRVQAARKAAR